MENSNVVKMLETSPYWNLLGMKVNRLEKGVAEIRLPNKPELKQVFAVMHGGAIASLLDAAGAISFFKEIDPARESVSTVELKINYLNPVTTEQDEIIATGKVVKKGKTFGVTTIEVRTKSGDPIAIGIGTYVILPRAGI